MREVRGLRNGSEVAPRMLHADGASMEVLGSGMGRGRGGGARRAAVRRKNAAGMLFGAARPQGAGAPATRFNFRLARVS